MRGPAVFEIVVPNPKQENRPIRLGRPRIEGVRVSAVVIAEIGQEREVTLSVQTIAVVVSVDPVDGKLGARCTLSA